MDDDHAFSSQVHTHELNGTADSDFDVESSMSSYQRFRHSDWATMRKMTFDVLKESGASDSALNRFVQCGNSCQVYYSPSEKKLFISADTCKNRFCSPCANARRGMISDNLTTFAAGKHLRLKTLTLAHHNAPLEDLITRIWTCFKLFRRRADWKAHVRGFAAFLEIKWSERSNWWHVHIHILSEGTWWDRREFSAAWHAVTGDSFITDIREVNSEEGIRYTAKYASKPLSLSDIPAKHRAHAVNCLHHRRLWQVGGSWKGQCKLLATKPLPADLQFVNSFTDLVNDARRGNVEAKEILTAIVGGLAEEFSRNDVPDFDDS
jgi:hypothetical protein